MNRGQSSASLGQMDSCYEKHARCIATPRFLGGGGEGLRIAPSLISCNRCASVCFYVVRVGMDALQVDIHAGTRWLVEQVVGALGDHATKVLISMGWCSTCPMSLVATRRYSLPLAVVVGGVAVCSFALRGDDL